MALVKDHRGGARIGSGRPLLEGPRWPSGRLIYDSKTARCTCGQPMDKRAKRCADCGTGRRPQPELYICACGGRKSYGHERCRQCFLELIKASPAPALTCEWCGQAVRREHRGINHDARRFCSKKCSGAMRTARAAERVAISRRKRAEQLAARLCLHCHSPMDAAKGRVHAACRNAYRMALYRSRFVSKAKHIQRICLWCQQPFTSKKVNGALCYSKRCRKRWQRVRTKHGLSLKTTDPSIIQCYRLLGDAYFALQSRPPQPPTGA